MTDRMTLLTRNLQMSNPYMVHPDMPTHLVYKWESQDNLNALHRMRAGASSFELAMLEAFSKASGNNRERLVIAFPWLWVTRTHAIAEAEQWWTEHLEGKKSPDCERCRDTGVVYVNDGPYLEDTDCPDCTLHDPSDLHDSRID